MFKKTGDYLVNFTKTYVDDEFEEMTEHRANTIYMWVTVMSSYVLGAVLCWVLPGWYSVTGFVVAMFPSVIAGIVAKGWMRHYMALPKTPIMPFYQVLCFVCSFVMALGVAHNGMQVLDGAVWIGVLGGGLVGGVIGSVIAVKANKRIRARDIQRIEAELED